MPPAKKKAAKPAAPGASAMLPKPGQCFAMPLRLGRWGACQVLGTVDAHVDVIVLDWVGSDVPGIEMLEGSRPIERTHHAWRGGFDRTLVRGLPPARFRLVGKLPLVLEPREPCKSWGGWGGLPITPRMQAFWDHDVPDTEKERYRATHGKPVSITLGGTTVELRRGMISLGARPGADMPLDVDERVDWAELDRIGHLTDIEYHGRDPGVLEYVASRKLVTKLAWLGHGQGVIDATRLGLRDLRLDVGGPLVLRAPPELERLTLQGHGPEHVVRVEYPERGRELVLHLAEPRGGELPPLVQGLEGLTSFEVARLRRLDLDVLAGYPNLESIAAWGTYGALVNAGSLRRFPGLDALTLYAFYDLATEALPPSAELPCLRKATFGGLCRSDAAWLKKHWAGVPELDIHGAKNDAWVAANAENPLRDWVDDDETFGDRACKAYAKAYGALSKRPAAADAEVILRDFVRALNKLDAKFSLIDTVRREQAAGAYDTLARLAGVEGEAANGWFDAERDF